MVDAGPVRTASMTAGTSGCWDWDIVADALRIDERFADLYGIDRALAGVPLPTQTFFSRIHPDDRARMRIAVAGILGGSALFSKEFRVLTADGGYRWMHGRGESHLDRSDEPVRFTGLLIDVTERKQAEERLRVAQSAGGVGTFEYRDGFATASVSDEFCRLLGLHPARSLPVRTINGLSVDGGPIVPDALPSDARSIGGEFFVRRGDTGDTRWIARRGEVHHEDGDGYRIIGVIYDVTEQKAAQQRLLDLNDTLEQRVQQAIDERMAVEEALRQAQKMEAVGQLASGIAHDFNNLLTIIVGNVETATRRLTLDTDPRAKRALDNAMKGAERAAALTQRLLAFSRRQPLSPKPTDIARLLAGMSDLLTRSITEAVGIQIQPDPDLWGVEIDGHQLENAILNLAVNARDAMPGGGNLTISAHNRTVQDQDDRMLVAGEFVAIEVTDTGSGMSDEMIAKVFDPFFTTKEVGKGTGLGLSMVYGFVTQSGGQITIDSTVGQGTTITLYLPRMTRLAGDHRPAPIVEGLSAGKGETILVVEDDDDVRAHTVELLRELGYRVIEAYDGPSALRLLERPDQSVQLLLTDVVMPVMSGSELADAAHVLFPEMRVLFISGYPRDAITRDGRLRAHVDLLQKPFNYETLAARIREALETVR
ncbi:hybrid sensor histidine kinase/response regulator [Sphingomonas nostoxanthinifaciens]|uniref:hybrid sensor histidine kinase/response regulator n=1 Tax=Sphingomonas nostoxanthinifaciens TaxID=2872652 RepID=UPI001CC1FC9D|nr:hybrid sensor histidine kinase/response regulator [Sphingomonas nostoxanthinifaciens]UAK24284.1 PAS domain-containing protein [Sphingomonas nostoxanthinifaciens]